MTLSKRSASTPDAPPRPSSYLQDESFIAKLGIISIQSRIDPDIVLNRRWVSEFKIGDAQYSVAGFAADFGRPRGVDTDIYMALQTLFILNGCPEDNMVSVSAYDLIRMVYGPPSAALYERTRDSLRRLWRVGFIVNRAYLQPDSTWKDHMQVMLSLFEQVDLWSETSTSKPSRSRRKGDNDAPTAPVISDLHTAVLDEHQHLRVTFSKAVAASLRSGNTNQLDWRVHWGLKQPSARGLYRLLVAHRPADGSNTLSVSLKDWNSLCGIIADTAALTQRMLKAAHAELIDEQYLLKVDFAGRGKKQTITYWYNPVEQDEPTPLQKFDPALVDLLKSVGFTQVSAEAVVLQYGDAVERAVTFVKARMRTKTIKSPAGLTTDVLKNPDKYQFDTTDFAQELSAKERQHRTEQLKQVEAEVAREDEQREAELRAADGESQWKERLSTLKFMTRGDLTPAGLKALERDCISGEVSAVDVVTELLRLKAQPDSANLQKAYLSRWNAGNQPQLINWTTPLQNRESTP